GRLQFRSSMRRRCSASCDVALTALFGRVGRKVHNDRVRRSQRGRKTMAHRSRAGLLATASTVALTVGTIMLTTSANAGMDEARRWIDSEFQPSTLSKQDQA